MESLQKIITKYLYVLKRAFIDTTYWLLMSVSKKNHKNRIKAINKIPSFQPAAPRNLELIREDLKIYFHKKMSFDSKYIYYLENSFVSYNGVIFKNFRLFIPSLHHPKWNVEVINALRTNILSFLMQQWLGRIIKIDNDENRPVAVIHDYWSSGNYYHWICDSLPRILLLKKHNVSCTILLRSAAPVYVRQTISWLGYDDLIEVDKDFIYKVRYIVVPEVTASIGAQNDGLMKQVRAALLEGYNSSSKNSNELISSQSRIYSIRASAVIRKVSNESEVIELLEKYGFLVVDFEHYSFLEQIEIMSKSDFLVGMHGANLTNMLFMENESVIIEFMNEKVFNPSYYHLSSSINMKYNYLSCAPTNKIPNDSNDDLYIDLDALEELVIRNI